jgi:sulfite reductase (ferredoxin)
MFKDLVHKNDIVPTLLPLLEHFKQDRRLAESFGDYCQRLGADALLALSPSSPLNGASRPNATAVQGNGHSLRSSSPTR